MQGLVYMRGHSYHIQCMTKHSHISFYGNSFRISICDFSSNPFLCHKGLIQLNREGGNGGVREHFLTRFIYIMQLRF
jgi:hypothetical protein